MEIERGFVAFEIKQSARVALADARHLRGLAELLDRPLLGGLILSQDPDARILATDIWAVPVAWALAT